MNKLGAYISGKVFAAFFIVLFLILSLDVLSALIDQLGDLRNDYTLRQAFIYIGLTIPGRVNEFIPLATLIGCLVAMGMLSSSSEIMVMRASGVSLFQLIRLVLKPTFWLIILSIVIAEFISPFTDQWATSHKDLQLSGRDQSLVLQSGLWHREADNFMHFNVVQPGGVLYGVTLFKFDRSGKLTQTLIADRASFQSNNWLLENVKITTLGDDKILQDQFTTQLWETQLTPKMLSYLSLDASELSPTGLFEYIAFLEQQGLDTKAYELAFWKKCLHPLAIMSLVLVAISFIFGPLRSSTMGYRIFIGVVVGISFQFTQNLLGPSSLIYGFSPFYAVLSPIIIISALGLILLYRVR